MVFTTKKFSWLFLIVLAVLCLSDLREKLADETGVIDREKNKVTRSAMSTEILYAKLKEINEQCAPERKQKKLEDEQKERDKDPFNRERKELAEKIKEIRKAIEDRDALYQKGDRVAGVKAGTRIRQTLMKEAQKKAEDLEKLHKERKKLRGTELVTGASEEKKKADEARQQIIDVMKQHLQELDKAERTIKTATSNDLEISESSEVQQGGERKVNVLPDLDDPIFDQVNTNEQLIDKALGVVLDKVQILKQDAIEIGQEIDEQEQVIKQVTEHVDTTFTTLKTVNNQLKETLQQVRSARTFCCDIILCLLILGIAGAIYGLLTRPH